jgi:hypothetical protein
MRVVVEANGATTAATRGNGHREKPPTSAPPVKKRRSRLDKSDKSGKPPVPPQTRAGA